MARFIAIDRRSTSAPTRGRPTDSSNQSASGLADRCILGLMWWLVCVVLAGKSCLERGEASIKGGPLGNVYDDDETPNNSRRLLSASKVSCLFCASNPSIKDL